MDLVNTEQEAFWSEFAPTWLELEAVLEQVAAPPGRLAMDRLPLTPGQRVIDLGCGTGATTVELAGRVSPGGEVLGVDIAAPMLDG
ncbi:MAG TPA: methyltransferase domain-containing protein, partial [Acidimicrobiales bacterium]|nr:methyltransferase domain-containing protein [Acidimicrobiales bacterium]